MVLPNEITCEIKPDATHPLSTGGPIWYIPRSGGDGAVASGRRTDFFPLSCWKETPGQRLQYCWKRSGKRSMPNNKRQLSLSRVLFSFLLPPCGTVDNTEVADFPHLSAFFVCLLSPRPDVLMPSSNVFQCFSASHFNHASASQLRAHSMSKKRGKK